MKATLAQFLHGMSSDKDKSAVYAALKGVFDRLSCVTLNSAALRIKGGSGSPIVQTNAVYQGVVKGKLITKATSQDVALAGSVTNLLFNVYVIFIDELAAYSSAMGIEAASLALVKFPPIPEGKAVVGYVIVNPTGTGNFVGGTTNLDDGTVAPNAVFVNTLGPFDPTALV